ncbi:hypothetical protein SAMN05421595_2485 [Austwickia chelonae]|uniref:ABC3 transporter permease protein domain-containing protein n=1 Tax=Austwickia chelonae NBRC 105200 TaxID=1184607 RepID=K6VV19_9MICO|nr:hypothetical protein [Austwickia chelonae]GAB79180.1 hypothetical protein AUCHE_21_00050 [Austwickia chelonae NBRC 105200]SEW36998.1 hypothetical protein SAMN05421595_2485 [Austwickia chelonae]
MIRAAAWVALRGMAAERRRSFVTVLVVAVIGVVVLAALSAGPVGQTQRDVAVSTMPVRGAAPAAGQGAWVVESVENYRGLPVTVDRIAVPETSTFRFPRLSGNPRPGEMVVSPALAAALQRDAELARRYPGRVVDQMPADALRGPRELRAVVGAPAAEVEARGGVLIAGMASSAGADVVVPGVVRVGAPVIAAMLCLPLAWLLWVTSGVESSARARRRTAMDLIGLPPEVFLCASALEGLVAAAAGVLVGVPVFFLSAQWVAPRLPVGHGVWPGDLRPDPLAMSVGLGVLLLVTTLVYALSSVRAGFAPSPSPSSGGRRTRPSWVALSGVLLGAAGVVVSVWWPRPDEVNARAAALLGGFLLLCVAATMSGAILARWLAGPPMNSRIPWMVIGGAATRRQSSRSVGMAAALALLTVVSGVLMTLFPTLGESGGGAKASAAESVGRDAIVLAVTPDALPRVNGLDPNALLTVHTPDPSSLDDQGGWRASLRCRGLSVDGGPPTCGQAAVAAVRAVSTAHRVPLPPHIEQEHGSTAIPPLGETSTLFAVFQRDGVQATERLRTDLIRAQLATSTVETLGEAANQARQVTRPFLMATVATVLVATGVAVISLVVGLHAQVRGRGRTLRGLRIAGMSLGDLQRSLVLQTCLNVWPTLALAWVAGLAVAAGFVQLSSTQAGVPVWPTVVLAVVSGVCAPAAVGLSRGVLSRASDPLVPQE